MKNDPLAFNWQPLLLLSLCFGLLAGCGGEDKDALATGTVSGTILIDGKPLSQGQVNFTSSTAGAGVSGKLQQDGSYTLDGPIPVGEYKVFISKPDLGDTPPSEDGNPELRELLKGVPKKHQSEATTDKTASVKKGSNTFEFDLTE